MQSPYARWVLPWLLGCSCSAPAVMAQRAKVAPRATGRVLELGVGLGLNLRFYDPDRVSEIVGVDPAPALRDLAQAAPRDPRLTLRVVDAEAEALPFEDASFDTVVCTFTLCSVRDPSAAVAEAARVLKHDGRLLFCEHGLAPDAEVARWQRRIEPVWKRLAGGCHLTRPVTAAISAGGMRIETADKGYLPHMPRIGAWIEQGSARRA
jgi:SAM-dependent methyltransferase